MQRKNVAVLGMGVGGLAVAILLARREHRVVLYDRMKRPGPAGSGFVLQPTGLEALGRMHLREAVEGRGDRINRMLGLAAPSGRTVLDVGYAAGRYGIAIQRRALFDVLHAEAVRAGVEFVHDRTVMGFSPGMQPRPVFERQGPGPAFDLLVDAMGARTPNNEDSRENGYGALWATVPWDEKLGFATDTLEQRYRRASRMAGILPVGTAGPGEPRMATVFWSVRNGADHARWKDDAEDLWPQAGPLIRQAEPIHATYRHHTVPPILQGTVLRIGDAWHATSPQLGQGANMALLDALSLDVAMNHSRTLEDALRTHVHQRIQHVRFYQILSYVLTPFYQSDGRLLPFLRDNMVAPLLRRRGIVHAMISAMVAGGMTDPMRRIIGRYEREVHEIARDDDVEWGDNPYETA